MKQHKVKHLPLGDINVDTFLTDYWQKKPLLIRQAITNIRSPISPEELAGLACDSEVESRLIIHNDNIWECEHGPFVEARFNSLPDSHWTLLVQAVDHYIPAVSELLDRFDFIPRWRIDDVMVSFASKHGGVGAHFDNYDVFLLQTLGQRLWKIGGQYTDESSLEEDLPVKIIKHFTPEYSWELKPGDMLYLPPGVGHQGISLSNDCMTCSVGFRAPSHEEILRDYMEHIVTELHESDRYTDPDLKLQEHSGEIKPSVIKKIHAIISKHMLDSDELGKWFGCYVTSPKYDSLSEQENESPPQHHELADLINYCSNEKSLYKNESSRYAFLSDRNKHNLFVDGVHIPSMACNNQLIELLCEKRVIKSSEFTQHEENMKLLISLVNHGALYLME